MKCTKHLEEVIDNAKESARKFHHNYAGSEHLLLAIANHITCRGHLMLCLKGLDPETVRMEVEKKISQGPETYLEANPFFTPRVRQIFELVRKAAEKAHKLNPAIPEEANTALLLYALTQIGDGIAFEVLQSLELNTNDIHPLIFPEAPPKDEEENPLPPTYYVWWLSQTDYRGFSPTQETNPLKVSDEVWEQFQARHGRPGHARLWIPKGLPKTSINIPNEDSRWTPYLNCGGIVITSKDVPPALAWGGVVTDLQLNIVTLQT
jgi:hypothetical protein